VARAKVTYEFPAELAARLRQVRKASGLTQAQTALLMGRQGKGAWNVVARLESGHAKYPSLGLVLDFLRACRVDVDAIADLLNSYCRRPVLGQEQARARVQEMVAALPAPVQTAVLKYDSKTALAFRNEGRLRAPDYQNTPPGRRAWLQHEPLERRLARVRRMANNRVVAQEMEQELAKVLAPYGASLSPADRLFLLRQATGVLAMRLKHGSAKRRRAGKTLDKAAVKAGFAGRQELELARALAEELYSDIETAGLVLQLRLGPPLRIAADPGRREAAVRRDMQRKDEKERIDAYGKERYLFQLALRNAGQELTVPEEERPARDVLIRDIS
jgi:transcriptional regulator with XRE-family HTH domain